VELIGVLACLGAALLMAWMLSVAMADNTRLRRENSRMAGMLAAIELSKEALPMGRMLAIKSLAEGWNQIPTPKTEEEPREPPEAVSVEPGVTVSSVL